MPLFTKIKSHITIEEAKEKGLTQIVRQLETDQKVRESLGLNPLTDSIKSAGRGRPKKLIPTKLIRTNFNNLT